MRYILKTPVCVFEIRKRDDLWELYANDECYGRSENPVALADNVASWATGCPEWDGAYILIDHGLGSWLRLP